MNVILIDGKNALYRYGYAMKNLRTATGQTTGAIYGFLKLLPRLKNVYPDCRVVVVWDGKNYKSGWRTRLYSDYKGNRNGKEKSEDLKAILAQEEVIRTLLRLPAIAQSTVEEVEADDLIGILAAECFTHGLQPYVYSSDRDFCQLMPKVQLIRDVDKERKLKPETSAEVKAYFRCELEQVLRVRAICGDGSDNIPGAIPGVGPVGAAKLVQAGVDPAIPSYVKVTGLVQRKYMLRPYWETIHRNYRIMRILQSTDDPELTLAQQSCLAREKLRVLGLIRGVVKERRNHTDSIAFASQLAELELEEAISKRHEIWSMGCAG